MNTSRLAIGVATALVMAVGIGRAQAKELPYKESFSGTFVSTEFDSNGDGVSGALELVEGKSTLGPFTLQGIGEFRNPNAPNPPPPCTLPNGESGFEVVPLPTPIVHRFQSSGDLLFAELSSGSLCFALATTDQSFKVTATITGGTGRFADATGSIEVEGTAKVLGGDAAGHFFGAQSGKATGTIILP